MRQALALLILSLCARCARAQDAAPGSDLSELMKWVGTQKANVGTGLSLHRSKYAVTWWDAISVGNWEVNVGKPGLRDFVDVGPGFAAANQERPLYGVAIPVHVGDIWNALFGGKDGVVSGKVQNHVKFVALPNVVVAPMFFWPEGGRRPLGKWTFERNFQVAIAYRFGGSKAPEGAADAKGK